MKKFLVADDHPLFREAMLSALQQIVGSDMVLREASSLDETMAAIEAEPEIDLLLFDLKMPGSAGLSGLLTLRKRFPKVPVLVISAIDESRVVNDVLRYGAVGFIPKSFSKPMLVEAIERTLAGDIFVPEDLDTSESEQSDEELEANHEQMAERLATLTPAQLRVLELISEGMLNKQIAYELDISETTVKAHVSAILRKLNVVSRTQAVIVARALSYEDGHESFARGRR